MIITVTLNPAIDKTVDIGEFVHGGLNRIQNTTVDAGGKGINVSKTLKALGMGSLAVGFLGGNNGEIIRKKLEEFQIQHDFIQLQDETRVNTKVVEANGCVTELNEPGPIISKEDLERFVKSLESHLKENDLLVLSGSVPRGVPKDIYKTLTLLAKKKGANVFVDADGALFEETLVSAPHIIKPNRYELEKYVGRTLQDDEVANEGRRFLDYGIQTVIISMGSQGAYFITKEHTLYSPGLSVKAHSTVGAGDAMVAAFSYGVQKGCDLKDSASLAVATSAGAVTTVGTKPPTLETVQKLLKNVVLE